MSDLFDLIYGILEVGSATADFLVKTKSVPDLNRDFCEEFIEKHSLKNKSKDEVMSIIKAHQTELFNYGITTQEAYLVIFIGSIMSLEEIEKLSVQDPDQYLEEYTKFKEIICDLTEA